MSTPQSLQNSALNKIKRNAMARGLRVTIVDTGFSFNVPHYRHGMHVVDQVGPFALVKPLIVTIKKLSGREFVFEFLKKSVSLKEVVRKYNESQVQVQNKYAYGHVDFLINGKIVDSLDKKLTADTTVYAINSVFNPRSYGRRRTALTRLQKRDMDEFLNKGLFFLLP